MEENAGAPLEPSAEQIRYAAVLEKGMYAGLLCLFVTFTLYVWGIMQPYVPREKLPEYWAKDVHSYLADAKIETGWSWVSMLRYGDFVNFIGIVVLAGVTVFCYLSILPMLLRKKDFIYAALALLEVLILLAAASGVIAVGH